VIPTAPGLVERPIPDGDELADDLDQRTRRRIVRDDLAERQRAHDCAESAHLPVRIDGRRHLRCRDCGSQFPAAEPVVAGGQGRADDEDCGYLWWAAAAALLLAILALVLA
jgi:hypothetical protein